MLGVVIICTFEREGKTMLQNAKEDIICKLAESNGRDVSLLDMETLQAGSIIQVTTESSSVYLLETIHECSKWVYFARYNKHENSRSSGRYFGKQELGSLVITIGETMTHDKMVTKPITKITLLCE